MDLKKILLIGKHEFITNFRRRSFLFTAFGIPILIVVIMVVVFGLVVQQVDEIGGFKNVAVIDRANVLIDAEGKPLVELTEPFVVGVSSESAEAALRNDESSGYYVIPADFMRTGEVEAYFTQSLALNEGLANALSGLIREALAKDISDAQVTARLQSPLEEMRVISASSGQEIEEGLIIVGFLAPLVVGMLIFILVMTSSQFLMSGLVEEKENRMMELFVTSARPSEMLWGKLLGLGGLGLAQIGIWLVFGLGYAIISGNVDIVRVLNSIQLSPEFLLMTVLYAFTGYFIFGALMAGIGATVNAEQEGRQIASLLTVPAVIPFMLMFAFITDPNGTLPTILSFIPITAPIAMILRMSLTAVPTVQIVLSLVVMVVSGILVMQISARIFRVGMLNYGNRPSIRVIWQAIVGGRKQPLTSNAHAQEGA